MGIFLTRATSYDLFAWRMAVHLANGNLLLSYFYFGNTFLEAGSLYFVNAVFIQLVSYR